MAKPLIVIVGQTAAGKTGLAIELARRFNGEIIAADSRTVYRGMDIGTAKPSLEEQAGVKHHLIDVVSPDQNFTAADFKKRANQAIDDITNRGKLPIMVGGSGLYVDAVIYDYEFRPVSDPAERARTSSLSVAEMQAEIRARGLIMPQNQQNPRHLSRVLETGQTEAVRHELRPETLIIGLDLDQTVLKERIAQRVEAMFASGIVEEAKGLFEQYGPDVPALETPGYTTLGKYLRGEIDVDEARQEFVKNDSALAKRQRTWFKRNKSIQWLPQQVQTDKSVELITTFLDTLSTQA